MLLSGCGGSVPSVTPTEGTEVDRVIAEHGEGASHPSALVSIWVKENGNSTIELLRDGSGTTNGIYAITWKAESGRLYITTTYPFQRTMVSNYSVSQATLTITSDNGEVATFSKATAQEIQSIRERQASWDAYSTVVQLSTAVDLFTLDVGRPPTNEEGLAALLHEPPGLEGRWKGPYIREGSRVDPWGNEFQYASPGVNSASRRYEIWSLGSNGASGTAEEIIGHWMPAHRFR